MKFSCEVKAVDVCGQPCHVKEMDGHSFAKFLSAAKDKGYEAALELCLACCCEADGKPCFQTLDEVGKLPRKAIDQFADHASKLNGLGASSDDTKSPTN